jgi:H+/Cl- antiporter ClcA
VAETTTAQVRGYMRLLVVAGLVGLPVSAAAFAFLALLHALTDAVWETLPEAMGYAGPPWWWPLPWLALAGVLVGAVIRYLPGRAGRLPVDGLGMEEVPASHLPGVTLAALVALPLGVVLGPEAPLIALGSGLAMLLVRPWPSALAGPGGRLLAAAGAAAAIAAIFGSPLVAAVFVLEAVGLARPALTRIVLPCLLSSGVGALVFTGLGSWTGLGISSLSVPPFDAPARPDVGDVLWSIPLAVVVSLGTREVRRLGRWVAPRASRRPWAWAVGVAVLVGVCASTYALLTGRSPEEVALSGQLLLAPLVADPGAWSLGALAALIALKSLAFGASLGALRGGAIFPVVLLGAAFGALVAGLPGYGAIPAIAAGMAAATTAMTRLPVVSAVLTVLLLATDAAALAPIVMVAVVVAFVTAQLGDRDRRPRDDAPAPVVSGS